MACFENQQWRRTKITLAAGLIYQKLDSYLGTTPQFPTHLGDAKTKAFRHLLKLKEICKQTAKFNISASKVQLLIINEGQILKIDQAFRDTVKNIGCPCFTCDKDSEDSFREFKYKLLKLISHLWKLYKVILCENFQRLAAPDRTSAWFPDDWLKP